MKRYSRRKVVRTKQNTDALLSSSLRCGAITVIPRLLLLVYSARNERTATQDVAMVTSPSFSSPLRHYSCRWQQWLELLFLSCDTQRFHFSNEQLLVVGSVFAFFFSFAFRLLRLDTSLSLSRTLASSLVVILAARQRQQHELTKRTSSDR